MRQKTWRFAAILLIMLAFGTTFTTLAQEPGEETVPAGGGRFAGMQRVMGEVTAIDGAKLTVKGQDGTIFTIVTTDNTRVMKNRGNMVKLADIKVGDGVMAAGNLDAPNKTLHAVIVAARDGAEVKKELANLGKTVIAGKVTAIDVDNAKMTIMRPDGVSQTIGFDESTSFRRGRPGRGGANAEAGTAAATPTPSSESLTLADIKVGDNVAGPGTIKNGTFVPSTLSVNTPGQGQHHHGGPGQAPPASGATDPGAK
jgi:hypothetical protein